MDRHISFGPGFRSDDSKSEEENRIARKEYYKKLGIDIGDITPEDEKRVLEEFKKGWLNMLSPAFVLKFEEWLKNVEGTWEERGIREDAPQEAKEAYAKYLEIEKEAKEKGV